MSFLDLIYPNVCGMCDEISKESICNKCKLRLKNLLNYNKIQYKDKYFNNHIYFFKYDGKIRERLLDYKFKEKSYLYKYFAEVVLNNCFFLEDYDIILPVPIHKKRFLTRGYNQADLIAKYIAKKANIRYENNVLIKNKNNLKQSLLIKSEREKNVYGVYSVINSQIIQGKNILLIDDIFTTGSTVNECAKVLKHNGAQMVDVLTISKGGC